MIDCLLVGFNDIDFSEYVKTVRSMGTDSGAYRDLNLAFIQDEGQPRRSMDVLNRYYAESIDRPHEPFSNADFLWPVITYLGSYLHRRGFQFDYVNLFHRERDLLQEKLQKQKVRTVAITTTLYVSVYPILEIVEFVRRYQPTAQIVIGGPYIDNQVKMLDEAAVRSLLEYIGADVYVIGAEGEETLVNLLTAMKNGTSLSMVNNIAYRDQGQFVRTLPAVENNSLNDNPIDYSLFPSEEIGEFVTLRTAKSCPFACSFCGFPQRAGEYTYLSVEAVERELNAIRNIGNVTTLTFIDDTFNVPKPRFKELMRMMIRNRYNFRWNSFLRSDHVDEEAIALMAESGCEGVFLGIESGSDTMLKKMNKTSRSADYLRVIPWLREAGIITHGNLIIGFPGETYETVRETTALIEEAKPDFYRSQLWYADPTTPVWRRREELGVEGSSFNWKHNTMDAPTAMDLVDKLFLDVENSNWLPQWGFEQWSLFYLQRKGMALDRIKTFVSCFNAAVKEKVVNPSRSEASPAVMDSLRQSCRFEQPELPDMQPIRVYAAKRYNADETYWVREFADATDAGRLDMVQDGIRSPRQEFAVETVPLSKSLSTSLIASGESNVAINLLAAFTVMLSRWVGRETIALIAALEHDGTKVAVPLKITAGWDMPFQELLAHVQTQYDAALKHEMHAFHLLTNSYRLAVHDVRCPVFHGAFCCEKTAESCSDSILPDYPTIAENLTLRLSIVIDSDHIDIRFNYDTGSFRSETMERLSAYFVAILEDATAHPTVPIGDLASDSSHGTNTHPTPGSQEEFDFS